MNIHRPTTLTEALDLMALPAEQRPTPIAGGTDLLVSWPTREKALVNFLDLTPLRHELHPFALTETHLELGALTTYWDVISHPAIAEAYPLLATAGKQVGAVQIQTRGTWAGNIGNGSPAADGVPVLMAYDAEVTLQSKGGGKRTVALAEYWTGYKQTVKRPDELIVALRLPRRRRSVEFWHKVGARNAQAITKVGCAVVKLEDAQGPGGAWRVVANSAAPYVKRCTALEAHLNAGGAADSPEQLAEILTADISPIDDIRSTAEYRRHVLARVIYFGLQEAAAGV